MNESFIPLIAYHITIFLNSKTLWEKENLWNTAERYTCQESLHVPVHPHVGIQNVGELKVEAGASFVFGLLRVNLILGWLESGLSRPWDSKTPKLTVESSAFHHFLPIQILNFFNHNKSLLCLCLWVWQDQPVHHKRLLSYSFIHSFIHLFAQSTNVLEPLLCATHCIRLWRYSRGQLSWNLHIIEEEDSNN